jgi:hypothetical protein
MRFSTIFVLAITLSQWACSSPVESGNQLAGQECFLTSDCAQGLACFERRCISVGTLNPNNNPNNTNPNNINPNNINPNNINPNNINPNNLVPNNEPNNTPVSCIIGESSCVDEFALRVCVPGEDGQGTYVLQRCDSCIDGRCVSPEECVDRDGDGYGIGRCDGPQDCDDTNPFVHPDRPEDCNTPYDDNCNGRRNENCEVATCCPNGCPDGSFCDATCACLPFDPEICQYQNQPCSEEGSFNSDFACASLGDEPPRCYGICQLLADDPNSTCPEPNSICTFGESEFGICLSECAIGSVCGTPELGCLPYGSSDQGGVCIPSDPTGTIGSRCSPNDSFPCESGAICIPSNNNPNVGRCEQACRPFEYANASGTDCDTGHCLPFSPEIGVCVRDNLRSEGEICQAIGTTCNQDAVGCFPSFAGNARCQRLCRLDAGATDCTPGTFCQQFDPEQTEIGVCIVLGP